MIDLLTVLRDELGADRVLPQPGWSTRTRPGTFRPGAVMEHWTASGDPKRPHTFSSASNPVPSLSVCINGLNRPDLGYYLPGPLYGFLCGFDGKLRLIHKGIGNHAGRGSLAALNLAMQGRVPHGYRPGPDDQGMSARTFGVSLDYHPAQGPPPEAMLDCAIRTTTALHRWMGWMDPKVIRAYDHRHATRRKRDNDVIADFRPQVADRLAATTILEEDDMKPFLAQAPATPVYLITSDRVIGVPHQQDLQVLQKLYGSEVHKVSIDFLRMAGAQV